MAKVTEYHTSFYLGSSRDSFHFFPARFNGLTGTACTIKNYVPGMALLEETYWSRMAPVPTTDDEAERAWQCENWTPVEAEDRFTAL